MNEKVSIIIPFYNGDFLLLHRSIKSILNSQYTNIEIIVIDDGSTDFNETELASYKDNIIIVHNKSNLGIASARNKGVQAATGKWVMWLDHDDYIDTDCIMNLLINASNKLMVIGTCIVYEKDRIDKKNPSLFFNLNKKYFKTISDSFLCNVFSLQPQIVRRDAVTRLDGFNSDYRYAEMTEFFLRFVVNYGLESINICDNAYYHYDRSRDNSVSKNRDSLEKYRKKALLYYATSLNIHLDSIEYFGRATNTQTQIFLPKVRGRLHFPSYLQLDDNSIISEE